MSSITVGCYERFVLRFDVVTEHEEVSLEKTAGYDAHKGAVRCVEGAGSCLASGGSDGYVRLYDAASGEHLGFFMNPDEDIQCLAFVPRNEATSEPTHLLGGTMKGSISVWDMNAKSLGIQLLGHKSRVNSIAVHRGGKLAFSTSRDSKLLLWDLIKGKKVYTGQLSKESKTIAFHPDGESYVIACDDSVHLTSLESAQELQLWMHDKRITCMSILNKDGLVATGTEDGVVRVWDSRSGKKPCVEVKDAHSSRLKGIHGMGDDEGFSNAIATACSDGIVKMWDLRSTAKKGFNVGCLCSTESGTRITCLTSSPSNTASERKAKSKKKKRKNRPAFMEETDARANSSHRTEMMEDGSQELTESSSDDGLNRMGENGMEPMGSSSGDDDPMEISVNGDMVELNAASESDDSDMEEEDDSVSEGSSGGSDASDGEEEHENDGRHGGGSSSGSRGEAGGDDDALGNGVSEVEANFNAEGADLPEASGGKRRIEQDADGGAGKVGKGRKGKKRQRKTKMEGDDQKERENKPPQKGAPVTPPPTGRNPDSSEPPSKVRSALKSSSFPDGSPMTKKKSVRFKDDDNIVEVLGVASGAGFDSVAEPNLSHLLGLDRVRSRGRGGGGRGRGRGKGKNSGRSGFGGGRGSGGKRGKKFRR